MKAVCADHWLPCIRDSMKELSNSTQLTFRNLKDNNQLLFWATKTWDALFHSNNNNKKMFSTFTISRSYPSYPNVLPVPLCYTFLLSPLLITYNWLHLVKWFFSLKFLSQSTKVFESPKETCSFVFTHKRVERKIHFWENSTERSEFINYVFLLYISFVLRIRYFIILS